MTFGDEARWGDPALTLKAITEVTEARSRAPLRTGASLSFYRGNPPSYVVCLSFYNLSLGGDPG